MSTRGRRRDNGRWQAAVALAGVAAAVVAVWVTLPADFLRYPAWLAAQKADFVIGPVLAGLYWLRRRPQSWFGPMLIGWGFVGALYILQSSSNSWLFSIGLFWEKVFGLGAYLLILAFPTGRLDRTSRIVLGAGVLSVLLLAVAIQLLLPQTGAGGSISSCRELCPRNELSIASDPALAADLFEVFSWAVLALAATVAVIVVRRFVTGTPPQRRALAIGTPVALLFLACEITFQTLNIIGAQDSEVYGVVIWTFVAARAAVWYGFLFALIGAELFAARAMERLVEQSTHHPSRQELEEMLREPLGDPDLDLRFVQRGTDLEALERSIVPGAGRRVTVVRPDASPGVVMIHDAQLDDDPELLNAAGAIAALAAENADLEAGWKHALKDLQQSRIRLVRAADDERQKVERNLHDGVQQQLIAIKLGLEVTTDTAISDTITRARLSAIADEVQDALDEVREVAHGLNPPLLRQAGLAAALQRIETRAPVPLTISVTHLGRYAPEVESAVYYCCSEAIQNATKYGSPHVRIWVGLREEDGELRFDVEDDGAGFAPGPVTGTGLQNMRDRLGALGGRLELRTAPDQGTLVSGRIPLAHNGDL